MEFDLDYEIAYWDGEPKPISEHIIEIIKVILQSDLEEFSERQIADLLGVKRVRLENLWKAGLLKKYEATKADTKPRCIYAPYYDGMLALSGDPEIRDLLQERAQRKRSVISGGSPSDGDFYCHRRTAHQAPTRRWPR